MDIASVISRGLTTLRSMDIDSDMFHSLLSLLLNSKVNLVRTPDKIVLEPFAQYFPAYSRLGTSLSNSQLFVRPIFGA